MDSHDSCDHPFCICRLRFTSNRPGESLSTQFDYTFAVRPANIPQITSTMTAPTTAPISPAPSPAWYHPTACPRKVATNAPTIPNSVVSTKPDGSLEVPG